MVAQSGIAATMVTPIWNDRSGIGITTSGSAAIISASSTFTIWISVTGSWATIPLNAGAWALGNNSKENPVRFGTISPSNTNTRVACECTATADRLKENGPQ